MHGFADRSNHINPKSFRHDLIYEFGPFFTCGYYFSLENINVVILSSAVSQFMENISTQLVYILFFNTCMLLKKYVWENLTPSRGRKKSTLNIIQLG